MNFVQVGILLALLFTLGLFVGYKSQANLGIPPYVSYKQNLIDMMHVVKSTEKQQEVHMPSVFSKEIIDKYPRVPFLQRENSGVVYDCVTWQALYHYDPEEVKENYQTFPDVQGTGEADDHRQQSFINIYNEQTWGGREGGASKDDINYKASGPGSALERSQGMIAILHTMIDRLKTQLNKTSIKILDLPCGDLQYMSHFLRTRTDVNYTGADIVPEMVSKHKENYKGNKNIHFKNIDIVKEKLNESYDIIICRMMLQHLVYKDVLRTLYHFSTSNSMYLAATTFPDTKVNMEVMLGGIRFRLLNLEKPPVNLSPPLCTHKEPPITERHYMAVWKLPLLQRV